MSYLVLAKKHNRSPSPPSPVRSPSPIPIERLMTFVRCPDCHGDNVREGNSIPPHSLYACFDCGWGNYKETKYKK